MKYSNVTVQINVTRSAVLHCLYCVVQMSFPIVYIHKSVEYDRPGEHSPEEDSLLLLTVTDVLTTSPVVILRVKVSCITSVDGIKL